MLLRHQLLLIMALVVASMLVIGASAANRTRSTSYYEMMENQVFPKPETFQEAVEQDQHMRSDEYQTAVENILENAGATPEPAQTSGQRVIDPTKPMVALTFDDGPGKDTAKILDILDQYGSRATFFVVGNRVKNFSDGLAQVTQRGSEVGTHTWSHEDLSKLSQGNIQSQLQKSIDAIENITGQPVTLMRPPYGAISGNVKTVCGQMNLPIIQWSLDTRDWETRSASKTYDSIMNNVKNGSIILCHEIVPSTITAMERVVPELINRGYQLVTVTELFTYGGQTLEPGKVYERGPQ